MSAIFVSPSQNTIGTQLSADGGNVQAHALRDGSLLSVPWYIGLVAGGKVHGVQSGSATTPTTFNATYGAAEPDLYIYVPANTYIIPLMMAIQFEDTGTAQVMDVFAAYSSNGDSAVTGTALTAYNYKGDNTTATNCTCTGVVTSNGTTHLGGSNFMEFWRPYAGFAEDAFNGSTSWVNPAIHGARWSALQEVPPLIGGDAAGALSIFASGQAATGFISCVWAEFSSSMFKA